MCLSHLSLIWYTEWPLLLLKELSFLALSASGSLGYRYSWAYMEGDLHCVMNYDVEDDLCFSIGSIAMLYLEQCG
jgi:hypothetical protein